MDEAKVAESQAWLAKARHDLQASDRLLTGDFPLCNAAGFHCQQAAEKTLKAYLTWQDEQFPRTHSLVALVASCLPFDETFNELRTAATTLTPYAVDSRYPGDMAELNETEARTALTLAQNVWQFVTERLPFE